jgi:hypothetical protein
MLFGTSNRSSIERDDNHEANQINKLRSDFRLTWTGVRAKLTETLSLHNAMNRYRLRCQSYDAAALRGLADSVSRPEDLLVAHVARFLFDQGLAPLLWTHFAGLETDILQPPTGESRWSLYIEAKQYRTANTAYLRQGFWEMEDHLARLAGSPYAPREGFYVVFRRGGPQYRLPSSLAISNIVVYPMVIDIAESNDSGSRQHHAPIAITEEELTDRTFDLSSPG